MTKFTVLLHGRDVLLRNDSGAVQPGGFYVNCCVEAPDTTTAAELAVAELRRHPQFSALEARALEGRHGVHKVMVESVKRVPWWRRGLALGITMGFAFYLEASEQAHR